MTDKDVMNLINNSDRECPVSARCAEFSNCVIRKILDILKAKQQECKELGDELFKTEDDLARELQIKRHCSNQNYRYRQALDKIKYEASEELKDLEADTNAYGCLSQIINIINEANEHNTDSL